MSAAHTYPLPSRNGEAARLRVGQTLTGPVLDVLTAMVPELAVLPRRTALEAVLNDLPLLHRCCLAFRANRTRFRSVLVDGRGLPVSNDNTPLACGRTVNQAVAMIVRSAAKRYFRLRRGGPSSMSATARSRLAPPPAVGFGGMLRWLMGRSEAIATAGPAASRSEADQLYDAIRRYLLHDWQVPIIPQYARMIPSEVRGLGARILDFRDAGDLAAYIDGGSDVRAAMLSGAWSRDAAAGAGFRPPPAPAPTPEAVPAEAEAETTTAPVVGGAGLPTAPLGQPGKVTAGKMLSRDGRFLRIEAALPLLASPGLRAALANPDAAAMARMSDSLSRTGAATVRRLMVDLDLSAEQMVVMLAAASLAVPASVFERMFGRGGDAALVLALVRRARAAGLGADSTPEDFARFTRALFGGFIAGGGRRRES
ncbi:hypothetical protein [Magnetospirillum sp. SS-4]|uniref:hypothetical protein n=1 Tax=Magnetospirillum sp. SS-4 TaxID=2681465 RepID=UPI00138052F3|nr:hypothetical protein [Magnetospirillum sp. SS-4]CAA7623212.1 conserved hypothetical protein [Magnetospirillum sp. SS-4]